MSDIDLTEAVEAAHVFTSTSRSRGRGVTENVASCTCGHPLDWYGRNDAHRKHVLAELAQAVREQVADEIKAFAADPAARLSGHSGISVTATRDLAARIARGDS